MTTAVIEKPEVKKKITWRDFTLEEHMRGFIGDVGSCNFSMGIIIEEKDYKVYRVNVLNLETEEFVKSEAVKVTETQDGYIFEIWGEKETRG